MKAYLYICVIALFSISCNEDNNKVDTSSQIDSTALEKTIDVEETEIRLDSVPRKFALKWVEFITAENEIRNISRSKVSDVMQNAETIAEIMSSLKTSIPDTLLTNPVSARLNVVETKSQLLKQYSAQREPDPKQIEKTAADLYIEFNNLKRQMNENFLKTLEDFEAELDKFEEEERARRDSLEQLQPKTDTIQKTTSDEN